MGSFRFCINATEGLFVKKRLENTVYESATNFETDLSPKSKSWDLKAIDQDVYFLYFLVG
jgi:hypothetical protein